MMYKSKSVRRIFANLTFLSFGVLASCPSEPTANQEPASMPNAGVQPGSTEQGSVIDEVEVMGADEAHQAAQNEINDDNVMDVLEDLEKEGEQ
ncbi:MAG: hypothetical protein ACI8X5_002250 [Planctomycetota bacterium]|jgi:hypothetical protein